jgi:hypothetical protein
MIILGLQYFLQLELNFFVFPSQKLFSPILIKAAGSDILSGPLWLGIFNPIKLSILLAFFLFYLLFQPLIKNPDL